jgi:hypothetical protein
MKTFPWKNTTNKICFVTAYIGMPEHILIDEIKNTQKINNCDYLYFTNVQSKDLNNQNLWNIINIQDLPNYSYLTSLNNNIRISRYFKFNFIDFLKQYCKELYNYEFIFWCDAHWYPDYNNDWDKLCKLIKSNITGIVQYKHLFYGIENVIDMECISIIDSKKETRININNTRKYLKSLNPNYTDCTQYFENTLFGYDINNKNAYKMFSNFWKHYIICPTYRDQPLWNCLYHKYNLLPLFSVSLYKSYFKRYKRKFVSNNKWLEHYNAKLID